MSYLEIGTIIIATATISASMFFLNKNDMESLINTAVFGVMLFFLFTVYFKGKLKEIKHRLSLPDQVAETAMEIYREAAKHRFTRGKHIIPMLVATIYLACRKHNMARPYEEIIHLLGKDRDTMFKKQVTKAIRLLQRKLNLGISYATAKDYIPLIAERLGLPLHVRVTASDLIEKAEKKGIAYGKDPAGLAAAALYIAAVLHGMRKTQQEVARAAHITEVTIRNRYKEFVRELNLEVPSEYEEEEELA